MQGQLFLALGALSDAELIAGLNRIVRSGRRLLAELLAHLCEVEDRRLHLDAGYPSLFAYCMARLGFTEDEAYRRINVARLARQAPGVLDLIAEGRLSLSVAALLQPYALSPKLHRLIEAVAGKSLKEAREALVAFFPRPDILPSIRKLPRARDEAAPFVSAPTQPLLLSEARLESTSGASSQPSRSHEDATHETSPRPPAPASPAARPSSHTQPLSPGRFKIQFTADAAVKDKLELARDLLRHAIPSGDLALIIHRALDLLVADLRKRRFGAKRPRNALPPPSAKPKTAKEKAESKAARETAASEMAASEMAASETAASETAASETAACETAACETAACETAACETAASDHPTAPAVTETLSECATRREVCERDGDRCTWQGADGVRCSSRAWLEQDHRIPRALGGTTTVQNLRLLCRAHNRRAAELIFGERHIQKSIIRNQSSALTRERHREGRRRRATRSPSERT